jgi:FAD/FMN-containing dehydrogenase
VDDLVYSLSGSISAEHGIGVAKRDDLTLYKSNVELELMWQLKRALDPKNLLNPKKLLPQPV